jgi:hypothetical protein
VGVKFAKANAKVRYWNSDNTADACQVLLQCHTSGLLSCKAASCGDG